MLVPKKQTKPNINEDISKKINQEEEFDQNQDDFQKCEEKEQQKALSAKKLRVLMPKNQTEPNIIKYQMMNGDYTKNIITNLQEFDFQNQDYFQKKFVEEMKPLQEAFKNSTGKRKHALKKLD